MRLGTRLGGEEEADLAAGSEEWTSLSLDVGGLKLGAAALLFLSRASLSLLIMSIKV